MPQGHSTISVFEEITCENCIFSRIEDDETIICCGREHFVVVSPEYFCSKGQWMYWNQVPVPPLPPKICGYAYLYENTPNIATLEDILREREEEKRR